MEIDSIFNGSKVLIVGGAGFVGSNLCKILLEHSSANITVVDNLLSAEKKNLPVSTRISFFEGSITSMDILANIQDDFDYIFHLATFHGNQNSIFDPLRDHENNTLTTLKLYEHVKAFKRLKKLVYSSAGCSVAEKIFGEAKETKEGNLVEINQDSPYSISKVIGEFYSAYFFKQHNLPVVRARFQNVYGPNEVLGAGIWRGTYATVWRNVIPTFIYKALKKESLPVQNNGIASRDFIFVVDVCCGLLKCAANGLAGDVYNIASGKETSVLELAKLINTLTKNKSEITLLPKRNWDNSGNRFGSTEKSEKELGFKASVSLEDGLRETIDWTMDNIAFIDHCIHKHDEEMSKLQ